MDLWFPQHEYRRILAIIRLELKKQIVAPVKVVKLRCWLYYKVIAKEISIRWLKFNSVIKEAQRRGEISIYHNWLTLDEFSKNEVERVYTQKKEIEEKWGSVASHVGYWFERIMRDTFREEGYVVSDKSVVFKWDGEKIEIDVYCVGQVLLGVEVKNKSSDVFHAPTIIHPDFRNDDHNKILKVFEFCKEKGITPVLLAPFIDKSFQGFAYKYKGLYIQTLFQFFPEKYINITEKIKERDFRKGFYFGNVQAVKSVPEHVRQRIKSIPPVLSRIY